MISKGQRLSLEVLILCKPSRQLIMNEHKVLQQTRLHSLLFVLSMSFFYHRTAVDPIVSLLHLLACLMNYSFSLKRRFLGSNMLH